MLGSERTTIANNSVPRAEAVARQIDDPAPDMLIVSADPTNPVITQRICTILVAEED